RMADLPSLARTPPVTPNDSYIAIAIPLQKCAVLAGFSTLSHGVFLFATHGFARNSLARLRMCPRGVCGAAVRAPSAATRARQLTAPPSSQLRVCAAPANTSVAHPLPFPGPSREPCNNAWSHFAHTALGRGDATEGRTWISSLGSGCS